MLEVRRQTEGISYTASILEKAAPKRGKPTDWFLKNLIFVKKPDFRKNTDQSQYYLLVAYGLRVNPVKTILSPIKRVFMYPLMV